MADDPVTGRDEVYDESREPRAGMPGPLRPDRQPIEEVLNGALGCRCGSTLFASSEMAVELRRCGYGDVLDRSGTLLTRLVIAEGFEERLQVCWVTDLHDLEEEQP